MSIEKKQQELIEEYEKLINLSESKDFFNIPQIIFMKKELAELKAKQSQRKNIEKVMSLDEDDGLYNAELKEQEQQPEQSAEEITEDEVKEEFEKLKQVVSDKHKKSLSAKEWLQNKYLYLKRHWNEHEHIDDNWVAQMMQEYRQQGMPSTADSEDKLIELADKLKLDFTKPDNLMLGWRMCFEWINKWKGE